MLLRLFRGLAAALLLAGLSACSTSDPPTSPVAQGGMPPFPELLRETSQVEPYSRFAHGSQNDPNLPARNFFVEGELGRFAPPSDGEEPGRSWAGYLFRHPWWQCDAIRLDWEVRPAPGEFWVGLADFEHNRWVWLDGPADDLIDLTGREDYRHPGSGAIYVQLFVRSSTDAVLRSVEIEGRSPGWIQEWTIPDMQYTQLSSVAQQGDMLAVTAYAFSGLSDPSFISLGVFDTSGELLWDKRLEAESLYEANVQFAPDGDLLVMGQTNPDLIAASPAFLARFSPAGELRWLREYGADGYIALHDLACAPGGEILVCGFGNVNDYYRGLYALLDANGEPLWGRVAGLIPRKRCTAVAAAEHGFAVGGEQPSFTLAEHTDGWVALLDTEGNVVWQRGWATEWPYEVSLLRFGPDGALWVGGSVGMIGGDWGLTWGDPTLLKLSADDELLFARQWQFGPPYHDVRYHLSSLILDGEQVVAGAGQGLFSMLQDGTPLRSDQLTWVGSNARYSGTESGLIVVSDDWRPRSTAWQPATEPPLVLYMTPVDAPPEYEEWLPDVVEMPSVQLAELDSLVGPELTAYNEHSRGLGLAGAVQLP